MFYNKMRLLIVTVLVAAEDIASVYFRRDVVEDGVVAVGDDGVAEGFELVEIVDDETAEEGGAVE